MADLNLVEMHDMLKNKISTNVELITSILSGMSKQQIASANVHPEMFLAAGVPKDVILKFFGDKNEEDTVSVSSSVQEDSSNVSSDARNKVPVKCATQGVPSFPAKVKARKLFAAEFVSRSA